MLDRPRVHIMLNYTPAEMTALIFARARRSKVLFAPYVYRAEMEVPIDHGSRAHALVFSGRVDFGLYPLRSRMRAAARFWPPLRRMSKILPHPGYPDIGQQRK